jgi:hypothetical protein
MPSDLNSRALKKELKNDLIQLDLRASTMSEMAPAMFAFMASIGCVFHDKLNAHVKDLVAGDADPGTTSTMALDSTCKVAAIVVNLPCKPGQGRSGEFHLDVQHIREEGEGVVCWR